MRCVAVGCKTSRKSGRRIHSFPRDPKRRLEWAVKVNLAENGKLWVPPKESNCYGICEDHFDEDQYEPRRQDRKLKAFAVPTLFEHRRAPRKRRKLKRASPPPAPTKEPDPEPKKDSQQLTAAFIAASNDHTYLAPRDQPPSTLRDQGPPKPLPPSATLAFTVPTFLPPSPVVFTTRGSSLLRSLIPATTVCTGSAGSVPASTASPMLLISAGHTTSSSSSLSVTPTTNSTRALVPHNVMVQTLPAPAANPQGIRPLLSIAPSASAVRISGPSSVTVQAATSSGTKCTFSSTTPITPQNLGTFTTMAPITPQNIVLPPFNCLPSGGPIILVPVDNLSQRAPGTVTVPVSGSQLTVPVSGAQLPIILSVESLQRHTGHTPILKKPATYEELQIEVAKLQSQAAAHCQEIAKYNAQLVKVKASLAKQTEQLGKFLNMDQVDCIQRLPGEKVKWTDKTLKFALEVYSCSSAVYRKLLDGRYPLPPELALKKYCVDNGVKEGVPAELFGLEEGIPEDEDANIVWL